MCAVKRLAYWYRYVDEAGRVALDLCSDSAANKLSSNVMRSGVRRGWSRFNDA